MEIKEYRIILRDIHLYAYHGVLPQENKVGAWYTIDLSAVVDDTRSIADDDVNSTVNYADIYEVVCDEMKIPSKLLENVCGRILSALFASFESIKEIEITLVKDTPPMGGDRLSSAVSVKATR